MALSQALSTGITGLMTHQKAMDNVGNNLANVNTVGFKKGVYQFSTLLEQSLRGGMMADSSTGRGSVNPIAMGLGAQTGSINKVFTQGPIENTGNPNDMAINGNGFFVLRQENGYVYTRAGSFYRGEDGSLMAGDGLYVQGTMAVKGSSGKISIPQDAKMQNIIIPIGTTGGHVQTSQVQFAGNLDSRQELSTGTRLFGSSSFPTVANLQSWMWKDGYDGGDSAKKPNVDETWNALQQDTFGISKTTADAYSNILGASGSMPSGVGVYSNGAVSDISEDSYVYYAIQVTPHFDGGGVFTHMTSEVVPLANPESVDPTKRQPMKVADMNTANAANGDPANPVMGDGPWMIPVIQQVNVINGGNVQTSTAYGIKVPEYLAFDETKSNAGAAVPYKYTAPDGNTYNITNSNTYPMWFYESTGSPKSYKEIVALSNELYDAASPATVPPTTPPTAARVDEIIRSIWPEGINGEGWPSGTLTTANLPVKGEEYAASLNTPLEQLYYRKGNVWVQPYANIKNGDDITIEFTKGNSQYAATFTYNRPVGAEPALGQVSIDREKSYTLEHLMTFLAGDVDEPSSACQNITPAMFGAPVDEDNPYGNVNATGWDRTGYEVALKNVAMATQSSNLDSSGGAMGLLSIPPQISDKNYGSDAYDTPVESAGAYTRTGVSTVTYQRWDPSTNKMKDYPASSFNLSIVSNLGSENAIEDIRITYNNVPHESMFSAETEYNSPQGGSSTVTVDFYDSLGNPKSATLRLAMVDQNDDFTTWRWYADCVDDSDFQWQADDSGNISTNLNVGTGLIRFDKNGNFVKGAEYSESQGITINQNNQGVNEPIWIKVLNGLSSKGTQDLDFSELTCSATSNTFKLASQNGRPPGTLNDFTVSLDGVIQGIYSNGNVVELARIGLAQFSNENGLIAAGSDLFYAGPASGDALYGHANTGGSGKIHHKQLESSNVDLSEEFTKLISIERGFQANSRTITTADEMITELLNLKR